jgi:type I restriction enzyme S subunit
MAGEWVEVSIESIASSIAMGPFGSDIKTENFVPAGVPVIRGNNLTSGRFRAEDFAFLTEEKADELANANAYPGDIVFTHRGTLGQVGLVPARPFKRYVVSQSQMKLTCSPDKAHPLFIYYFFRSPVGQHALLMNTSQTGVPAISRPVTSLKAIRLALPPLPEQRAIAHILGTLDDKIELNRRMSQTLEAMARALFKSWFVDFDPVAKAEGRDPGLPQPLADFFPARLVDSELGEIPEGWAVETLGDHFDAVKGVSYKGSGLGDSGMPLHNLNSVYEGGGYKYEGIKYYAGEYAERHVVRPGDVIVANTEQGHDRLLIGYAAIVPRLFGDRGIASHHIYRLRPKPLSPLTAAFLCHLLNWPQMHDVVSGYANGTTVNMLPIDGVQKPQVVCPPRPLVAAFDSLALNAEKRREEMVSESRTLAALRDALLPRLISGELRVRDAETMVSRADA